MSFQLNTLTRRRFVGAASATLAATALKPARAQPKAPAPQPMNVLFFIADDLGWGDLACCGHPYVQTPNVDRLAAQGTRFTGYYGAHTVCSPSRAAIMTGHFPARHGVHGGLPDKAFPTRWLDADATMLPRLLQNAGYATAHFGKWHLGMDAEAPPVTAYGFDEHRGTLSNGPPLWDDVAQNKAPYFRALSTGRIVDLGLDFVRRRAGQPFYLHLASLVPHHELKPTPEELAVYSGQTFDVDAFAPSTREFLLKHDDPQNAMRTYYSALTGWDAQVGRLLDGLDAMGLTDNTLIILTSDHGPAHEVLVHPDQAGSTGPHRGRKGGLTDGGVRVPFLARCPNVVPAGGVEEAVIAGVDWLPTACELTGIAPPADYRSDGQSRADVFRGTSSARTQPLFWERSWGGGERENPRLAMRRDSWKLHARPASPLVELYDLASDASESRDLSNTPEHAARAREMRAELMAWRDDAVAFRF